MVREVKTIPWWWTAIPDEGPEWFRLKSAFSRHRFSMGEVTHELEERLGKLLGTPYVVVTPSGTAALTLALLALGVGPGDEVVMPDLTWIATAQAAHILGAKVVAVDSRPDFPLMDTRLAAQAVTSRTKAIIPVHYNGRECGLEPLAAYQDLIVEDACKALGSQTLQGDYLGTMGAIGCFSLGLVSLVTAGYGGAAVTRNQQLYNRMLAMRDHGVIREHEGEEECYLLPGFNWKVSDLLASIALGQMEDLDGRLWALRQLYYRYAQGLEGLRHVHLVPVEDLPLLIDVVSPRAGELREFLCRNGVEAAGFHPPLHTAGYLGIEGEFPHATSWWREGFNLPSGPGQKVRNIDRVIDLVRQWDKEVKDGPSNRLAV